MEVLTYCYSKSMSSMIIKSPSIFYSSKFMVYPCPAGVIDFKSYNCINCKVPKRRKKVNLIPKPRWGVLT